MQMSKTVRCQKDFLQNILDLVKSILHVFFESSITNTEMPTIQRKTWFILNYQVFERCIIVH